MLSVAHLFSLLTTPLPLWLSILLPKEINHHIILHSTEPISKMGTFKPWFHTKSARTESCCWLLPCLCCPTTNPLDGDKQLPNKLSAPWHNLTYYNCSSKTKYVWWLFTHKRYLERKQLQAFNLHYGPQTTHPMLCAFFPTSIYHAIIYFQQITAQNLKTSSRCYQLPPANARRESWKLKAFLSLESL